MQTPEVNRKQTRSESESGSEPEVNQKLTGSE